MPRAPIDNFRPVTKSAPCKVCGKADWCRRSQSGGHECHRGEHHVGATTNGLVCVAVTNGGFGVYRVPHNRTAPTTSQARKVTIYPTVEAAASAAAGLAGGVVETVYEWSEHHCRVRIKLPNGGKTFRPISRNGSGWLLADPPRPCALYRIAEVPATGVIYVAEGEKACDASWSIGLPCVTSGSCTSADAGDWSPLAGRHVVLLPDNDEPGEKYAQAVRAKLLAISPPATVRVVRLPGLPVSGDLWDFANELRDGQDAEIIRAEVEALTSAAPVESVGLRVTNLASVTPKSVEWLWPGRIPVGKLTALVGDPKVGKSVLTLDIAARVSTGAPWPNSAPDEPRPEPGRVLIFSAEDDVADTICPRLIAAGADMTRIDVVRGVFEAHEASDRFFSIDRDLRHLERHLETTPGVKLVIVDPVSAYMGKADSHVNAEVRGALAPLAELAARFGVAIVTVTHMNKAGGAKALYRAMGSLAFTAVARAVWTVMLDARDPSRHLMLNAGCNLVRDCGGLAYSLTPSTDNPAVPLVEWERGAVNMSADEALAESERADPGRRALDKAVEWLRAELANGPVDSEYLRAKAAEEGIADRTLKRARARLGLKAEQVRDEAGKLVGWRLRLPGTNAAPDRA